MEEDIRLIGYFKNEDSERECAAAEWRAFETDVFFLLRSLATPVDALNWAVGSLCLHTLHQESSLTPSSPWIYRSIFTPAAHTAAPDQNMHRTGRQENEAV